MYNENQLVDLLRHSRHEWLNDLQLIKSNLSLDRVDRAEEIIDAIIIKTKNEAKLSNLNVPEWANFMLTFNWHPHAFKLEFEVVGTVTDMSDKDAELSAFFSPLFHQFDQQASYRSENRLEMTIALTDHAVNLSVKFIGQLNDPGAIIEWINTNKHLNQSLMIVEQYIVNSEAVLTLQLQ